MKSKRFDESFRVAKIKMYEFYTDPANQKLISETSPLDSVLWEAIFVWFFNRSPDKDIPQPDNYERPGMNDPLWDELLHNIGGMEAQQRVIKIIKRIRNVSLHLEAA